jgi:GTPase SAR1 family protein
MAAIWLDVLDETIRVGAAHGRTDLVQRLQHRRAQLLDPTLRVTVIGEPNQGKSQLVNALINAPVCPAGGAVSTALPTVVQHAEAPTAALVSTRSGGPPVHTPVPVTELPTRVTAPAQGSSHAEVGVPRGLLAAGLVLVDTPGTDRASSLTKADVVVMVSDATRELSVAEIDRLLRVAREHPVVLLALTKIDMVPHWRQVAERNRRRLAAAGAPATVLPVSAELRLRAARINDKGINAESGFPDLIAALMRLLAAKRTALAPAAVRLLVATVVEQLATPLRTEPPRPDGSEPLARLQEAQRGLDELRRCSARWQNALADEIADLISDLEYDLRDRTRRILREVDEAFEVADPLRAWDAYRSWLDKSLLAVAEANFAWLVQRCEWIAGRLANHFVPFGADILPDALSGDVAHRRDAEAPDLAHRRLELPGALSGRLTSMERPSLERFTVPQKVFAGLRGSYLGVLMFGLATTLAGMPLVNPISLSAGGVFAGKGVWDESRSVRKRRQAAVKTASHRHVDEFFLRLNKESKDTARWVQRMLREHYTALTDQIHDDIVHSLRTAKQAADADVVEREQRHREARQLLRRLSDLSNRAKALEPA